MRKPKTNDQTEWWIKKQIRKALEDTEWSFWMPAANVFGTNGMSDFLAVKKPEQFLAIEAKYNNTVTAQQFQFLNTVHEAGHYAFLVDETNIGKLENQLAKMPNHYCVDPIFLKWQTQNPIFDVRVSKLKLIEET